MNCLLYNLNIYNNKQNKKNDENRTKKFSCFLLSVVSLLLLLLVLVNFVNNLRILHIFFKTKNKNALEIYYYCYSLKVREKKVLQVMKPALFF